MNIHQIYIIAHYIYIYIYVNYIHEFKHLNYVITIFQGRVRRVYAHLMYMG